MTQPQVTDAMIEALSKAVRFLLRAVEEGELELGDLSSLDIAQEISDAMYEIEGCKAPPTWSEDAFASRLQAALAHQAPGEDAWRPIEEHEGNGLPIMLGRVASDGLAGMRCSGFLDATGVWRVLYSEGGCTELPFIPTHFRPLPNPPKQEDAQNG